MDLSICSPRERMATEAALTCRIEDVLHHMDHAICCHQIAVWYAHRVDVNGVVYLGNMKSNAECTSVKEAAPVLFAHLRRSWNNTWELNLLYESFPVCVMSVWLPVTLSTYRMGFVSHLLPLLTV